MSKKIVLILNLGTPDAPEKESVKRYLNQFLMDPDVVDLPWLALRLLVSLLILPFRSTRSTHAYASIWTEAGSPLLVNSQNLCKQLQEQIDLPVYLAMRYGSPAIEQTLLTIQKEHIDAKEIIVLPMYPHYAGSTRKSCDKEIARIMQYHSLPFTINTIPAFYEEKAYIHALVESAKPWLEKPFDHLLFSYHGVPERHLIKEDPSKKHCLQPNCCDTPSAAHKTCYRYQVLQTTKRFVEKANLSANQYSVAFQSRVGKAKWLQPYTSERIIALAKKGVKHLLVICPAFTADCLETLEEIQIQERNAFIHAGGKELTLIPCLNSHPTWVNTLQHWITDLH